MSDTFVPMSFVADELLTSTKMNLLATNLSGLHSGDAIEDQAIIARHMVGISLFGVGSALDGTPPAAGTGQFYIQPGSVVVTANGSGSGSFTWPTPFPNGLVSVVGTEGDTTAGNNHFRFYSSTKTGTSCNFQGFGGGPVRINYVAIGF